jgi:hypothetical protein
MAAHEKIGAATCMAQPSARSDRPFMASCESSWTPPLRSIVPRCADRSGPEIAVTAGDNACGDPAMPDGTLEGD